MRVASSPAVAMSPAVAAPRVQSQSAPPIRSTGRAPASAISQKRKSGAGRAEVDGGAAVAVERVERRLVLVQLPWLKSLTVAMLVMVSTTWPVTTARAAARALERARMRGM